MACLISRPSVWFCGSRFDQVLLSYRTLCQCVCINYRTICSVCRGLNPRSQVGGCCHKIIRSGFVPLFDEGLVKDFTPSGAIRVHVVPIFRRYLRL